MNEINAPRHRFSRRVLFYLLSLSLITSVVSGSVYYTRQVKFITEDRAARAATLLNNLATQSELGAYARDPALCEIPARRLFHETDVVLVGIYDVDGAEILHHTTPGFTDTDKPDANLLAKLRGDLDSPPISENKNGYIDLWTPILTSSRNAEAAAFSEPGTGATERALVGFARIGLSLSPGDARLHEVLQTGVYLALGLMLIGALAALLITRRISRPIMALARGVDQIRAGNLEVAIPITSQDEVGVLADSFNRMAVQLRETMQKLENLNRNLEGEVSHRTEEIRRSAEFTELLNAPLEQVQISTGPIALNATVMSAPETFPLRTLVEAALASLVNATGVAAAAVLVAKQDSKIFELNVVAIHGTGINLGRLPSRDELRDLRPQISGNRALIPLSERGQPLGALVLEDPKLAQTQVDFAARAAGQLSIAIANVRAYDALRTLAQVLKQRNTALEQQRDQLQQMNKLKSEFLANTSHELRTPLNAIMGYTELIEEEVYGPITGEQREGLQSIAESARNLLTLISQILDLSKVESGKMDIYPTDVAIHDVAQTVAAEALGLLKGKSYKVEVLSPQRIMLRTDQLKVQQILTNLVSNAIKFTDKGFVRIEIGPSKDGGCIILVKDSGIGIEKKHLDLIFEEFRQVDGSSTRKYGGTGLGLAISRRFAQLLGGKLTAESETGRGSTFRLTLPKNAPGADAPLAGAPNHAQS